MYPTTLHCSQTVPLFRLRIFLALFQNEAKRRNKDACTKGAAGSFLLDGSQTHVEPDDAVGDLGNHLNGYFEFSVFGDSALSVRRCNCSVYRWPQTGRHSLPGRLCHHRFLGRTGHDIARATLATVLGGAERYWNTSESQTLHTYSKGIQAAHSLIGDLFSQ